VGTPIEAPWLALDLTRKTPDQSVVTAANEAPSESWVISPATRRFSAVELLLVLIALFASFPFIERLKANALIESILLTVTLLSAVLAIAARGSVLIIAILLAVPSLAGRWIHHYRPDVLPPEVFLVGAILLVIFVIWNLLAFVLHARVVNTEVLCASISAYLLLGLVWTFAYWLVADLNPRAFALNASSGVDPSMTGFNGLYFSLITLSTVGYGDITPVSNVARMLAAMEAVTGVLYVAVLIARLVSIQTTFKSGGN
jgi:ion channel